ncbi:MAG TPA: hypothetical protein VN455_13595 [Methanotrichaceae archaeon]|nr:hypothetical protein [Methanotrichaceae archaeon]
MAPLYQNLRHNIFNGDSMDEIEERAHAQLGIIEQAYSIKIKNKDEVARFIAENVDNKRRVLTICTSLNAWIASNQATSDLTIPLEIITGILDASQ